MTAKIKLNAASGGGSVSLKAPSTTTSNAAVELQLPVADGSNGQFMKTDGSGNLSFATAATSSPTVAVARTNQTSALSGGTNYDITLPANCYQVEFSAMGVSTSGSGSPAFRFGTSSGIISTGSYYNIQGKFGASTEGQYNSGDNHINFCNINMNGAADTGDIQARFLMAGPNYNWTYNITTIRRGSTNGLICIGYGDLGTSPLTTIRFFPYGTGFDNGRFSWTAYSTV